MSGLKKRMITLLLTLVLSLGTVVPSFAVTVIFKHSNQVNAADGVVIWGGPVSNFSVSNAEAKKFKKQYFKKNGTSYYNNSNVNPLGSSPSVMDAILKAAKVKRKSYRTYLDLVPQYGNPGAAIRKVGIYNTSANENSVHYWGQGWQAKITLNGNPVQVTQYLSHMPLNDDYVIEFLHSPYDFPK